MQVGFNAGNGTQAYEYKPYSQNMVIRDLANRGWGNGFPGRHIFRIDEQILIGSCNKDIGAYKCWVSVSTTEFVIGIATYLHFDRCCSAAADICARVGQHVGRSSG